MAEEHLYTAGRGATIDNEITRLYCLVPDVEVARRTVRRLIDDEGCSQDNVHLVANDEIALEQLPDTGSEEDTSDFLPGLGRGVATGGTVGLLAGITAVSLPAAGITLGGGLILALTGMGAAFGAVISSLVGASLPHTRIKSFEEAIERGEILLMVDVDPADPADPADAARLQAAIEAIHPDAHVEGTNLDRPSSLSLRE
ncbi:MAG: DUF1269 domain-containing protein [Gammaproteobacteria bacterium]